MMRFGMEADYCDVPPVFLDPLVRTGRVVREPQNRRAVIEIDCDLTAALTAKPE